MGYRKFRGLILNRRDVFEDDQEISILTESGCFQSRVPHARRSQKSYCGRLEPPNYVSGRLYRSKKQSDWIVSSIELNEAFATLFREESVRTRLWPLLSLFRDVFPEGESPGDCFPHLKKGLTFLREGFRPSALVTNRILANTAVETGVSFSPLKCSNCERQLTDFDSSELSWEVYPTTGRLCPDCEQRQTSNDQSWSVSPETMKLFDNLITREWSRVKDRRFGNTVLRNFEEFIYRLFHYHFEISLETLKVRKTL